MLPQQYGKLYTDMTASLEAQFGHSKAMELGVGGDVDYEAMGILERELLIQSGLGQQDYLIDVGCGSGRLAAPLSEYLAGRYLGLDVVPDFLTHAAQSVNRADWRFELTTGQGIPEEDSQADMICFFSVFTHILHEHTFLYLREARRVLKPQGKIIFSYLDFSLPLHWPVFENTVQSANDIRPPVIFMSLDAIQVWARHLNLQVEKVIPGDQPYIQFAQPHTLSDGTVLSGLESVGQSICILSKPEA